jgi:signal transduction histidine kinase
MTTSADSRDERLALLAMAGDVFARSLDRNETLDAIARTVVPRIADWCRVDLLDDRGELRRAVAHHSDPVRARYGWELVHRLRAAPDTVGSMLWAVETGKSHLAQFDPPMAYDASRDRDLLTFAAAIGMRAYYVVPLIARGRTLGALAALQAESGRNFTSEDCAMIEELGRRAALALDNARLYAEAEAARHEAERANRAKDEFLGVLGHELRNPLAPIVMALEVMARSPSDAVAQRRIIERQVTHLTRLVDDLLDVSRITQGKIALRRDRVDLRDVVAKAIELTRPMFERRTRSLVVETAPGCFVEGDEMRLAQVVANLLINAAKFTPDPGAIRLRLTVDDGKARLEVSDEGMGIEPSLIPHVFDLFVQGKQSIDRVTGGLGLGLAIVRTLVEMHGGDVQARSEGTGRGSVFVLRLPLVARGAQSTAAPGATADDARPSRHARILVVDDNRDAATTLATLLDLHGYVVATAGDGREAIAAVPSFEPDVAILDIGLPGMDGYELAVHVRRMPRPPRLLALTGYGTAHDRERALAAGFDDHLVKPVDPDRLLEALDRAVQRA